MPNSAINTLNQFQRRMGDLSACLDWVLANQATQGRYPTAMEKTLQLSLPLRWLAERAQMELAALHDLLNEIRDDAGTCLSSDVE